MARNEFAILKILLMLSNLFTHLKLTDMETCYKTFKREVIQAVDIKENRFGFEPEITAKIAKMNVRVKEVPISYYPRTNEEGKKIGYKDGIRAIYYSQYSMKTYGVHLLGQRIEWVGWGGIGHTQMQPAFPAEL